MGTRADFYIKEKEKTIFLGSTLWDGYPNGIIEDYKILSIKNDKDFKSKISKMIVEKEGNLGKWCFPWDDSKTTDYTYIFNCEDNKIYASCYGSKPILLENYKGDEFEDDYDKEKSKKLKKLDFEFPDMRDKYEKGKSGFIILQSK